MKISLSSRLEIYRGSDITVHAKSRLLNINSALLKLLDAETKMQRLVP